MRSIADKYSMVPGIGVVVFDPVTMTAVSLGATAIGGAATATGALASGSYAKTAGAMQQQGANFQAEQIDQNAGQARAASQRQMLDTQEKTRLAISSSVARAGASGVDASIGSPVENVGQLAERGSYHALMDMFNGESTASGLENQAKGIRYTGVMDKMGGDMAKTASYLAAGGDIAGSIGSMASRYGAIRFPTTRGSAGVNYN